MTTEEQLQLDKMSTAICTATGWLEALAEMAMDRKQYDQALQYYRGLKKIHEGYPLGMSKQWILDWEDRKEDIYRLMHVGTPA